MISLPVCKFVFIFNWPFSYFEHNNVNVHLGARQLRNEVLVIFTKVSK